MRTMFWCSLLSAALAAGACKKSSPTDTGEAGKEVKKSQEKVQEQRKDLEKQNAPDRTRDQQGAPADQTKGGEPSRTPTSEETKGEKKQADMQEAQADLQAAHQKYSITVRNRIKKIDIRLRELEQRGDATSRAEFTKLRAKRDAVAQEANQANTKNTASDWDAFQKDVDNKLDSLDKDVNDALSNKSDTNKTDTNERDTNR